MESQNSKDMQLGNVDGTKLLAKLPKYYDHYPANVPYLMVGYKMQVKTCCF